MDISELFWNVSLEELKKGYAAEEDKYCCLLCGHKIEKGIIYPDDGIFYEAEKYMRVHIKKVHGSVFEHLIQLDKKITGLTDHQNSLLRLFYQGKSDEQVKAEMNIGSVATVRNHRFGLKEKERQAKVFLTMMELLKAGDKKASDFIHPHDTATMVDDRYKVTVDENDKLLKKYFPHGLNGPIETFSMKEKNKLVVLKQIVKRFEKDRIYSEKEVNEVLKTVFADFVILRRYLIEYGFMERKPDGSQYWVRQNKLEVDEVQDENPRAKNRKDQRMKDGNTNDGNIRDGITEDENIRDDNGKGENVERKKELKQQYKEVKIQAGVYMIKNIKNQKVLVASTKNLKTMNGKLTQLQGGGHQNKQLQEEWKQFGAGAFVFEVLEVLEEKKEGYFDQKEELEKLEAKWLERLQPYGERGYNAQK